MLIWAVFVTFVEIQTLEWNTNKFLKYSNHFHRYSCRMYERCSRPCIDFNHSGLTMEFNQRLYGQPLVNDVVVKALESHFKSPTSRALALAFHGPTGVGKSYVARMVANHLFYLGMESNFVHYFVASRDFPHSDEHHLAQYREIIDREIRQRLKRCRYGLFIFDEIDKMPIHLIDTITSFLDFNTDELRLLSQNNAKIDFTRAVFIFLSNSGERTITNFTMNAWKRGIDRRLFTIKNLEKLLANSVFNEAGGLWHTELIQRDLLTFIIPFLPLERDHLKQCIVDYLLVRNYTHLFKSPAQQSNFILDVLDEIIFVPEKLHLFSSSGCKRVPQRVEYLIMDVEKERHFESHKASIGDEL
ncbi:hypothetical protein ACOME3_004809 [Neoechinorhynchus agilis]